MKRAPRKPAHQELTPEQFREYIGQLRLEHQAAWQQQVLSDGPEWIVMLGLHLRLVELERLADGLKELL